MSSIEIPTWSIRRPMKWNQLLQLEGIQKKISQLINRFQSQLGLNVAWKCWASEANTCNDTNPIRWRFQSTIQTQIFAYIRPKMGMGIEVTWRLIMNRQDTSATSWVSVQYLYPSVVFGSLPFHPVEHTTSWQVDQASHDCWSYVFRVHCTWPPPPSKAPTLIQIQFQIQCVTITF